jgi:molybdenum cofactor guanylyltransferase
MVEANRSIMILAGGQSSRMGTDKVNLPFGGELLLQRIVRLVSTEFSKIIVVAGQNQAVPELPEAILTFRDSIDFAGPLNGLVTGLPHIQTNSFALIACDLPLLNPNLLLWLFEQLGDHQAVVPKVSGFYCPLLAVYSSGILPIARQCLSAGKSSMMALIDQLQVRFFEEDELRSIDPNLDSFQNINTPKAYQQALERLNRWRQASE